MIVSLTIFMAFAIFLMAFALVPYHNIAFNNFIES